MNLYKLKHIQTGLYYNPGVNNLSKKGKIYTTNSNVITMYNNLPFIISVCNNSNVYKQTKDILNWEQSKCMSSRMILKVSPEDFIKEYI